MIKVAFYDTKPYDRYWFDKVNGGEFSFKYLENKLNEDTAKLAHGCEAAVAFVNDTLDKNTIDALYEENIRVVAMRCTGFNNIDFKAAYEKIRILRVPVYSPYAVAEHAMALLLTINRKTHRAYNRTRDYNFSLNGLTGFDLYGKTAGIIGTGKIGQVFMQICRGFGMRIIAYDPYPVADQGIEYVSLEDLFKQSDIISLHCPLNESTYHIIDEKSLEQMKPTSILINTSRGALVDSEALVRALQEERIGGAGLDVYEEEADFFFEDYSNRIIKDTVLRLLVSLPNVIITSHQAFLTAEALESIANTTVQNLKDYFDGKPLKNEMCYYCQPGGAKGGCKKVEIGRCY
ncbi:MAG: 2-hydroxyacid dehydrogenase [Lachnospiraceae bacterium]